MSPTGVEAEAGRHADRAEEAPMNAPTPTLTVDLTAVKTRQQATWASGDYARIGTTLQLVGENLCEAVDCYAGAKVLDVAAGNGNASLAAARRGADVLATDYVEHLLVQARRRAEADGLPLTTEVADAEALPYGDAAFDIVLSTFGVMFTPDPARAAAELLRVCRPGGRIGLANWTPDGFVGRMFGVVGRHVPPPAGVPSPLAWGTEERLHELFDRGGRVRVELRRFTFRFRSADEFFDTFRTYYGPTLRAWEALDADGRASFRSAMVALADEAGRHDDGALAIPSDYLEVVVDRT
jgi:SAM-dependent methyltransferase